MTLEVNGNFNYNGLVFGNLHEVDVKNSVAYGMELEVLQDGLAGLAIIGQVDYIHVGAVDELAHVSEVHYQVGGDDALAITAYGDNLFASQQLAIVLAVLVELNELATIQDNGNLVLLAEGLSGLLAEVGTSLCVLLLKIKVINTCKRFL